MGVWSIAPRSFADVVVNAAIPDRVIGGENAQNGSNVGNCDGCHSTVGGANKGEVN